MPAISRAQDIIQFLRRKGKPDIELRDCQQGSTRERMKEKQVFEGEPWLMRTANHHFSLTYLVSAQNSQNGVMAMLKSEIPTKHFGHSLSLAMVHLTPMVLATFKQSLMGHVSVWIYPYRVLCCFM